jgi:hypothetical protein
MIARKFAWHGLSVCRDLLNVVLAALAALLIFLLVREDLPVPDLLRQRIEREAAAAGIEARFDAARLYPSGGVLVQGLRLEPERFGEPLIEADMVFVRLDRIKLATGALDPVFLYIEGLRLACPAALSPTGKAEVLVEIPHATLRNYGGAWEAEGIVARVGNLHVEARGVLHAAGLAGGGGRPAVAGLLQRFAELAPRAYRARKALEALEEPAVRVVFDVWPGRLSRIEVTATAEAWRDPRWGEAGRIEASTEIRFGGPGPAPVVLRGTIGTLRREGAAQAGGLAFALEWPRLPTAQAPWPAQVHASAFRIAHPKAVVDTLGLEADLGAFPSVKGRLSFAFAGEAVALEAQGDASTRAGTAHLVTRFGRGWLQRASEIAGRDLTYYARIEARPDLDARVDIAEGLRWRRVEFRALAGPLVARGVPLDRARVHGVATPDRVHLDRLEFEHGGEAAAGTYTDTLATRDNRFLLRGRMRPLSISPWFGPWWRRFWSDCELQGPPPAFDIDVRGNWLAGERNVVRGRAEARQLAFKGVKLGDLRGSFFIRPNYYDLFAASIVRPEGRLDGEVQLHYRPGQRDPAAQTFRFVSTADLVDLARIFGKGGEDMLAPYRYEVPPRVDVEGSIERDGASWDTKLALAIETRRAFRYWDFPLESLETTVRIHNRLVEMPRIAAGCAGGMVRATAIADHGVLSFDAALAGADYDAAVETFRAWLGRNDPPAPPDEGKEAGLAGRKTGGRLDITFAAKGPATDFQAYEGAGTARVSQADLGQIKTIGLLSDLFATVGLSIAVLEFDEAASSFEVRRDRILMPDIRITGPTAALKAGGTYFLRDHTVDFRASLHPLRESSGAITKLFGKLLDPFSGLLEIRLTGTLRHPKWIFTHGPTAILRFLAGPEEPAPAPENGGAPPMAEQPPAGTPPAPPPAEPGGSRGGS